MKAQKHVVQKADAGGANSEPSRKDVWRMFDRIAPRYDLINRWLSFGLDVSWRKRMASLLPEGESLAVLDLATGTADQLLLLCDECDRIDQAVGMDLSENMLEVGRKKVAASRRCDCINLKMGDAVNIPEEDHMYHAVTISFGIRNVLDMEASMKDMLRVLRPNGRALILECSLPENALMRIGHVAYLRYAVPLIGAIISGDMEAYRYLNKTVETFPSGEAFCELMRSAGFEHVKANPVTFGVATIYQGDRPAAG